MPATSLTSAMRDSALDPSHRSRARVRAQRTRLSSYGFFCSLGVTPMEQFHALSCTVILPPSALTRLSRSAGVKLRNWIMARSPRTAATWAEALGMKMARKPRSEEHTSELQSRSDLVCRLLLEKKKKK